MIRHFGKLFSKRECKEILTSDFNRKVYYSLTQDFMDEVPSKLKAKINSKKALSGSIICCDSDVYPHIDDLRGLSKTCWLVPLRLPKAGLRLWETVDYRDTYKDLVVGHLYTFNQHNKHSTQSVCKHPYKAAFLVVNIGIEK